MKFGVIFQLAAVREIARSRVLFTLDALSARLSVAVLPTKPRARHNIKNEAVKLKIHLIRSILVSVILRRSNPSRSLVIRHTTHQHIHLFFFFLQLRWVVGSPICLKNEIEREEKRNKVCKEKSPFRVRSCIKASTYRWSIARGVSNHPPVKKIQKITNQARGLIFNLCPRKARMFGSKTDFNNLIDSVEVWSVVIERKTNAKHLDLLRKLKHETWNTVS